MTMLDRAVGTSCRDAEPLPSEDRHRAGVSSNRELLG